MKNRQRVSQNNKRINNNIKTQHKIEREVNKILQKGKSVIISREFIYWIALFICTFLMEMVVRWSTVTSPTNMEASEDANAIVLLLIYAIGLASIISSILCFIKNKKARFVTIALVIVFGVLIYSSQVIYNQIFHTYYTIYSMIHGAQVAQFWRDILKGAGECAVPLLVILVIGASAIVLLYVREKLQDTALLKNGRYIKNTRIDKTEIGKNGNDRKNESDDKIRTREALAILLTILVISLGAFLGIVQSTAGAQGSAYEMMYETNSIDGSVRELGLGMAMIIDTTRLAFGTPQVTIKNEGETGDGEDEQDGMGTANHDLQEKYEINKTVDFDALIKKETDPTLKSMHEYFASVTPTLQNEKTGLFAGKNLIMIVGESFSSLAIDKKYTPTLYKLQHEGFYFENFYNPLWGVSTSDGEYVACQGLIPKQGVWSMRESSKNYLPYTMGRQFERLGVRTLAYHNHYAEYYGRTESHPNMGYKYKGLGTGLKVTEMWPESDLQMIELTTKEYLTPDENGKIAPFHVYYMTVSGHLNYNFSGQAMCKKNKEAVADLDMSEPCKAYIACNIELDKAMERLLDDLENAGELENTVIVMSGDHYPYGLNSENISEFLGHEVDEVFEIYRSSLIIYHAGTEPETVTKYCSSLDIIPTVSNLFGLEYDSRLLMGRDIFSSASPLVIFKDKSWITARASYNAKTKESVLFDKDITDAYIQNVNNMVTNKFNFSRLILEKDYYGKIREYLYSAQSEN